MITEKHLLSVSDDITKVGTDELQCFDCWLGQRTGKRPVKTPKQLFLKVLS